MPLRTKGVAVPEKRIITKLPEPVYRALKIRSAETDKDMQEIITDALKRHLGLKEEGVPTKQ
jgi:plasmid stability protein